MSAKASLERFGEKTLFSKNKDCASAAQRCVLPVSFRWFYNYGSYESTGNETGITHLYAMVTIVKKGLKNMESKTLGNAPLKLALEKAHFAKNYLSMTS